MKEENIAKFFNELSELTGLPVPSLIELVLEMVTDGRLLVLH